MQRYVDMWIDIGIDVAIDGRFRMHYLYFIYTPVFTVTVVWFEAGANKVAEATLLPFLHSAQVPSDPYHSTVPTVLPIPPL